MNSRKRARVEEEKQEASSTPSSRAMASASQMSDAPAAAATAAEEKTAAVPAVSPPTSAPSPLAVPPSIHAAPAIATAAVVPSAASLSRSAEFQVHRSRLLRLMDAFPQLVAEMADAFERQAERITAAAASTSTDPHASSSAATTVAVSGTSPAASSHAPLALLPSPHPARLDALRDHALVPGVIALVLSFVPIRRRIHLGRVCRRWQSALQQSSLWVDCGWHGYQHDDGQDFPTLPSIILRHLTVLRCGVDWLLRKSRLKELCRVPQLRRLDVLHCCRCGWRRSLFRQLHWPALHRLAIWLTEAKSDTAEPEKAAQLLHQAVSPQRMPELQTPHCDKIEPYLSYRGAETFSARAWLPILPRLFTLTTLTIGPALLEQPLSARALFLAVGAHSLPSLSRLDLQGVLQPSVVESETREVDEILQRMDSLTHLLVGTDFHGPAGNRLHSLHLLPSLLTLRMGDPGEDGIDNPQSVVAAPKLQSLSCGSGLYFTRLAQLWWRRLGQPQLDLSGIDEDEWARLPSDLSSIESDSDASAASSAASAAAASVASLVGPAAPAIRELKIGRACEQVLDGCAFAYLAHLPHLHTLHCALDPADLGHLALLPQLRSLTVWLHDSEEPYPHSTTWTAAAVWAVGSSLLPLLHTLRLEGDDQSSSTYDQNPSDPNFPWEDAELPPDDDAPVRASHVAIPVEDGLEHLLRLPSLTRLALPYVSRDALDLLRDMATGDRPELHIERIIPHSRRSDFDRRWIEHGSPAFPQEID